MTASSHTDWWREFIAYCADREPNRTLALEYVEKVAAANPDGRKRVAGVLAILYAQLATNSDLIYRNALRERILPVSPNHQPPTEADVTAPMTKTPRLRFPFRKGSVAFAAECSDSERIWSLLVESAGRSYALRLTRKYHSERETLGLSYVALTENAIAVMGDTRVDAKVLAHYLLDIVMAGSSEKMSADCLALLRQRLCEAIETHRKHTDAGLA